MKKCTNEKLIQIINYRLLANVGQPVPDAVVQVDSWPEAIKHCQSRMWDGCLMMARNALCRFAHQADWYRGHEWNNIAREMRPLVDAWLQTSFVPIASKLNLPKVVGDMLSWYAMHVCFEVEYQDIVKPLFYLPLIDPWLQRGHFPCGWVGEEFPDGWNGVLPQGKLVVF